MNYTSHFSNFADFRQLQISNARAKYYEILPAHTKTSHNTTHKVASLYFEFKYHFSTLQKKLRLLLNKGVHYVKYVQGNVVKSGLRLLQVLHLSKIEIQYNPR